MGVGKKKIYIQVGIVVSLPWVSLQVNGGRSICFTWFCFLSVEQSLSPLKYNPLPPSPVICNHLAISWWGPIVLTCVAAISNYLYFFMTLTGASIPFHVYIILQIFLLKFPHQELYLRRQVRRSRTAFDATVR
jgi:hypothetical protein